MSVLADVKAMLGIEWNNYDFDEELKIYINSALSTLEMLGAPTRGTVEDQAVTWPQLLGPANPPEIKPFVYLKVRQLFDPPQNAFWCQPYSISLTSCPGGSQYIIVATKEV